MGNVIIRRNVQPHFLGAYNVSSQFAEQYVNVDKFGKFGNHIIPVTTSFLFVSHLTVGDKLDRHA